MDKKRKKRVLKKIMALLQAFINLISILVLIYFLICYVDVVNHNISEEKAQELKQHEYNIFVWGCKK